MLYLGDRDELNELDQALEMFRAMPRAELAIIPNADHFHAAAKLSNEDVLDFLERHS